MNFNLLFRKEITESLKTYKLLIVAAVLFLFGLSSPLLLKFLPNILEMSNEQLPIQIPTFTAGDAIKGYISNLGQIGLLIAVLISMGSVAQERERRTAIMTLSKPVGFGNFVTAKLASLAVTFAIGLILGGIGCYWYSVILLGPFSFGTFALVTLLSGLYLLVCLSVTMMCSSIFKNQLAAGGMAFVTLIVLALLSNLPPLANIMPVAVLNDATRMVDGAQFRAWPALIVSIGIVVAAMIAAWQILKSEEL